MRRPRLRDDVNARRYIDGETSRVILASDNGTFALTSRSWAVALAMDGTRDSEGLRRYAKTEGAHVELLEIERLIDELETAHLVEDAAAPSTDPPGSAPPEAAPQRRDKPIFVVDSFRLDCDGGGICCRLYPTILFSPEEAARARATLPLILDGGYEEWRVFTPEHGGRSIGRAVAVVDGRCAYLARNGLCGLHAKAGPNAKPLGCRAYPARYVDEGARIVVSPSLECPCVFRSRNAESGEPIVESGPLDPALVVDELPHRVELGGDGLAFSRSEYLAWADAHKSAPLEGDASRTLMRWGLELTRQATNDESLTRRRLAVVAHFHARLTRARANSHRSSRDFVTTLFEALDVACSLVTSSGAVVPPRDETAADETFYVHMLVAGHQLIAPSRTSLGSALEERAARIAIARALHAVREIANLEDPVYEHPLALIEAASRLLPTRAEELSDTI